MTLQEPRPLLWRTAWCAAGALLLAGCGAPSDLQPVTTNPWGGNIVSPGEGLLVGSQLWCSVTGEPVEVFSVGWDDVVGIEVVDFSVVTQPAAEVRVGVIHASADDVTVDRAQRTVRSPCADFAGGEDASPDQVSYLVMEVQLTDPTAAGAAHGLVVRSEGGEAVEPMSLVICPEHTAECTSESGPPEVVIP